LGPDDRAASDQDCIGDGTFHSLGEIDAIWMKSQERLDLAECPRLLGVGSSQRRASDRLRWANPWPAVFGVGHEDAAAQAGADTGSEGTVFARFRLGGIGAIASAIGNTASSESSAESGFCTCRSARRPAPVTR
jgi:hypothetical protein